MNNKATKRDAVRIIRTAVKDGWTRTIDTMRELNGKPWCLQVNLMKSIYFPNGYLNMAEQIIISFRRSRRNAGWIVSMSSTINLNGGRYHRGLWHAGYALKQMREACERQSQRNTLNKNVSQ